MICSSSVLQLRKSELVDMVAKSMSFNDEVEMYFTGPPDEPQVMDLHSEKLYLEEEFL